MKALFYIAADCPWVEILGGQPWALLPVAGRPFLSYWIELCVDVGIEEIDVVLGAANAAKVEQCFGNGEKWGVQINYSVAKPGELPHHQASKGEVGGIFFVGQPIFPRRRENYSKELASCLRQGGCRINEDQTCSLLISSEKNEVDEFCRTGVGRLEPSIGGLPDCGVDFERLESIDDYYRLNMDIVDGEMGLYVTAGYAAQEEASIGYNVIIPPSVRLEPPLAIGNDCRIGPVCSIGPRVVVADHVFIDGQCELTDSIILSDTFVGRNLELKGKIVCGNRIIDPEDGGYLDIEDPWLLTHAKSRMPFRDVLRASMGWILSLCLVLVQALPFAIFYTLVRMKNLGSFMKKSCQGVDGKEIEIPYFIATDVLPSLLLMFFFGFSLDRFPQLLMVLKKQLWLCGQVPRGAGSLYRDDRLYFPAVFSSSEALAEVDRQMEALFYVHTRSVRGDLRILHNALFSRLLDNEFFAGHPFQQQGFEQ